MAKTNFDIDGNGRIPKKQDAFENLSFYFDKERGETARSTEPNIFYYDKDKKQIVRSTEPNTFYYNRKGGYGIVNILAKRLAARAMAYGRNAAMKALEQLLYKSRQSMDPKAHNFRKIIDKKNGQDGLGEQIMLRENGAMKVNNGTDVILALDFVGNWCPDAVMLGIPVEPKVSISQSYVNDVSTNKTRRELKRNISSDTLVWYDVTGLITIQNERKLIITPVTGRDFSRKELMSNGDVTFTITGRMNSNLPDVYPTEEVQKFIQIMQYKGPVKICSQLLSQYNIEKMVITGYSLPQKEGYRNIQEYTINCVGVQPQKDVKVTEDTILSLNREINLAVEAKQTMWQKLLDEAKDRLKATTMSMANSALNSGVINKAVNQQIDNATYSTDKAINTAQNNIKNETNSFLLNTLTE